MDGDAFALLDSFFSHQAKCDDEAVDFDWYFAVNSNLLSIHEKAHLILASVITDAVAVQLPGRSRQRKFIEVTEVFRLFRVLTSRWLRHAWKRQESINAGNDIVAYKKVEGESRAKI